MPIYGSGRIALNLTATDFELNNIKINGAIVNGASLVVNVAANSTTKFDTFDDAKYKAAKYTILGKSANHTQMCEVLITVPVLTDEMPLISVYGVVTDDDSIFSYFNVTATRTNNGSHDIELFINSSLNESIEVSALRTYIV